MLGECTVAIKVRIPKSRKTAAAPTRGRHKVSRWRLSDPLVKTALAVFVAGSVLLLAVFAHYYVRYERMIDRRLRGQLFSNSARIYARPRAVAVGQKADPDEIAAELRRAGYSPVGKGESPLGNYRLLERGIEIRPGPESYHNQDGAVIRISDGKVERIVGLGEADGKPIGEYELEPLLITSLDTEQRSKRQLVQYKDIPKVLVDAVLAIEDRRFFQHGGVNFLRLLEAAYIDLREGGARRQGGSTITMQVSRAFFLNREKTLKRKAAEILIAIELDQKLTKQQIFELYANMVDLGQRGSFTISGFAEAARAYFNKDLQSLTLPEAALLAGMVQRPSYLNPYRHPERALDRRNLVLEAMVETGAINREQADRAKATPLKLAAPNVEASDAPYFIDLVKDSLLSRYSERDLAENSYRIYTTLDPDLQRAAAEAVEVGIKKIDEQVQKLRTRKVKVGKGKNARMETKVLPGPEAQVALIAMDPKSGEVLALVGGRNYGMSQLNHAVARRPTGSVFKPFVFAAAINSAIAGDGTTALWTPASLIEDAPTTFTYGDQIYEPRNYKDEYHGMVSARFALAHSLNNATVKLAEEVGYENVATLARAAGLTSVKPTPAMALGAYDATPMEVAAAYTVFANNGVRISPIMVTSLRDARGNPVETFRTDKTPVLDPRVAYVMTSMMEGVINNGTAYPVRAMGFNAPAAGKTGTSHDGWFAGYTSNLLCIVWVGFDDYSDLRLSGAYTAAPIWGEFMKRAVKLPQYSDVKDFSQPEGVVDVRLDKVTNRLATASCPDVYSVAFIAGTEPKDTCDQVPGEHRGFLSRILGLGSPSPPPAAAAVPTPPRPSQPLRPGQQPSTTVAGKTPAQPGEQPKKKKGFFGKIVGIFSGDDQQSQQTKPPDQRPQP